jgi:Methane oxygenase PmoA
MKILQSAAVCLLLGTGLLLPAGGKDEKDEPAAVTITVAEDHIDFLHGKALATRYHFGPKVAKPFFWPVNSPAGVPLTRGWPMEKAAPGEAIDHIHQKSLWFCHGDIIPEGIELKQKIKGVEGVDFWSETPGHGLIVCSDVGTPEVRKNHGKVATFNTWRTADNVKVLEEKRLLHLHNFGPAQLLVLDIELHASAAALTFGDTKEGSLGVRVRQELTADKGKGVISNADGKVGEKGPDGCWGRLSAWCDYSGPIAGKTAGITVFTDPDNPYPTCWHSRGYGLMAANPFGRDKSGFPDLKGKTELVKLEQGKRLKFRFGVLLHDGDVKEGKVAEYYKEFVKLKG